MSIAEIKTELAKINVIVQTIGKLLVDVQTATATTPTAKIGSLVGNTVIPIMLTPGPYWTIQQGGYLAQRFGGTMRIIAQRIAEKYPDRYDLKMQIGHACPEKGQTFPTNPAHRDTGLYLDIYYYQTGAGQMWDEDGTLNALFDVERNKAMLTMFRQVFTSGKAIVDNRIKSKLGMTAREYEWVFGDSDGNMNHDAHVHLECRSTFNGEAVI